GQYWMRGPVLTTQSVADPPKLTFRKISCAVMEVRPIKPRGSNFIDWD
ncbi:MAG: hypothetical protein ACI9BW_003944, partial [Gammaproteobacteria bacterium]